MNIKNRNYATQHYIGWNYLNKNLYAYHLTPTRTIPIGNEKYARGYHGIAIRSRF